MKSITILSIVLILISCTMRPRAQKNKMDHKEFKELHEHKGAENYEVVELFDKEFEIRRGILVDKQNKNIVVKAFKEQKLKDKNLHIIKKLSIQGEELDRIESSYRTLKDGTIWGGYFYCNFNIDGDSTRHKFLDPFSNKRIEDTYEFMAKETDPDKWLVKFQEYYKNASYVKISRSDSNIYYLKVEGKWYFMENTFEGTITNLKDQYPPKENQDVRMAELENLAPVWYHKGFKERDTSLIKMIDYESTFYVEENFGLINQGYSAGWWYLEVYMPLGDTLKIKRYAYFEDPELKLYKIPGAYGGREDVLFIVQKPKEAHMEQVGGMYAIRPRDPDQPQRRYGSVSYGTRENGEEYIIESEDTEEYTRWQQKRNQ